MNTSPKLSARIARAVVPAIPCLWLLALFVTPFVIVLKMSLSDVAIAQPPYTPLFDFGALGEFLSGLDMENYEMLLGVPPLHFIHVLLLAVVVYGLGVPLALYIAVERGPRRAAVVLVLLLPYVLYALAQMWSWGMCPPPEAAPVCLGGTCDPVTPPPEAAPSCNPLKDWFIAFAGFNTEGQPLPVVFRDLLMRIYMLLGLVALPVFLSTGSMEKRHCFIDGAFSLSHTAETMWRKGKVGLVVAALAVFAGATAFLMQREFNGDSIYWEALLSSLKIAVISTVLLLLVGFPIAYAMARAPKEWRPALIAGVMLPFWIVFLIRIYSWKLILEPLGGFISSWGMFLGILDAPVTLLNSQVAVFIGIVYGYLPFMILPLYATLEKMDLRLIEAATDLGSPPWRTFWTITVPLAKPGIFAGSLLCFIPAVGEFVIPDLLGGSDTLMIGKILWSEFFSNRDWPLASSVAIVLLIILLIPIMVFQKMEKLEMDSDEWEGR